MSAIHEYLSKGWSCFPLKTQSKEPAVKWAKYYEARASERDISEWPETGNVGIATGKLSGLVVVDFDPAKGGRPEEWLAKFPTDLVVDTGSGGVHAYYEYPSDGEVRNAAGFLPGVDIRAQGGYVVAPPSIHPCGLPYVWRSVGKPAPLPHVVVNRAAEVTRNDAGWVSDLMSQGAGEGKRDDSCAKLAGWCAHKGMGKDEARAFLTVWNRSNRPPLHASEIDKTIESVFRKEERVKNSGLKSLLADIKPAEGFQLQAFTDYMAEYAEMETPWIIKDWLPSKTICFAISPPGTFKTWSVLDLCVSVATGTKFLNHFDVDEPGPVILVQQEDYHGSTVDRLSVICQERFDLGAKSEGDIITLNTAPEIPIYVHTERRLKFEDKEVMKAFTKQIETLRPKMVVIDPFYSVTSTDDYMTKAAESLLFLKSLRDEYGTSFVICHHTKKSGDDKGRDRLWGSQFLNAALETGWQMSLAKEKQVKFVRHFKAAANPTELVVEFNIDTSSDMTQYRPRMLDDDELGDDAADAATLSKPPPSKNNKARPAWMKVMDFFSEQPETWHLAADVEKALELKHATAHEAIERLVKFGHVRKEGKKLRMTKYTASLHKRGEVT
jgi:hypothetical protein